MISFLDQRTLVGCSKVEMWESDGQAIAIPAESLPFGTMTLFDDLLRNNLT